MALAHAVEVGSDLLVGGDPGDRLSERLGGQGVGLEALPESQLGDSLGVGDLLGRLREGDQPSRSVSVVPV